MKKQGTADTKPAILIIDDSDYQRSRLKSLLEQNGYSVLEAVDAVDGLYACKHETVDIVILDINMPYMQGVDALPVIREIDRILPVIMFSTLDDESIIKEAIRRGARDYIVKPLRPDRMLNTIRKHLDEKGR